MKTFKRTYLPDSIEYNGETYFKNPGISTELAIDSRLLKRIPDQLKAQGRKAVLVEVLSNNLRGRTDLHGNLYKPTVHVLITKATPSTNH